MKNNPTKFELTLSFLIFTPLVGFVLFVVISLFFPDILMNLRLLGNLRTSLQLCENPRNT